MFEIAYHLGMTRGDLDKMPYMELQGWIQYFKERPPGWREDHRAAVIALSFGGGKNTKPSDLFPSLKEVEKYQNEREHDRTEKGDQGHVFRQFLMMNKGKFKGGSSPEEVFKDGK